METLIAQPERYKFPGPQWLEKKINKLHVEMDQLRMSASDKCRKILAPVAPCGPEIHPQIPNLCCRFIAQERFLLTLDRLIHMGVKVTPTSEICLEIFLLIDQKYSKYPG